MTSKFARFLMATAFVFSVAALAQTGAAATPRPADPGPAAPTTTNATGTKVGTINIEQAVFGSNEGQRDIEALSKKLAPKQNELKGMNDELDSLQKQLSAQGEKLNDEARATLVKQIEQKKKVFDRAVQDARDDAQNQQNEIFQRILQKMGPVVLKYAGDNTFGVILDTSNQWPQGPVLWTGPSVDITKAVVDAYNAQSGVAAPVPSAPQPSGAAKPSGATTRPVPPATPKPQRTQPPK